MSFLGAQIAISLHILVPDESGRDHRHDHTHSHISHTQHYTANCVTPPAASMAVAAVPAMRAAAEKEPVGIERGLIAAPRRSQRRPPSGHGTGRERGGCGRAPESVAAAAAASDAPLDRLRFVHKKRPRKECLKNRAP